MCLSVYNHDNAATTVYKYMKVSIEEYKKVKMK